MKTFGSEPERWCAAASVYRQQGGIVNAAKTRLQCWFPAGPACSGVTTRTTSRLCWPVHCLTAPGGSPVAPAPSVLLIEPAVFKQHHRHRLCSTRKGTGMRSASGCTARQLCSPSASQPWIRQCHWSTALVRQHEAGFREGDEAHVGSMAPTISLTNQTSGLREIPFRAYSSASSS